MNYSEAKQIVLDFFDGYVEKYAISDLDTMLGLKPGPDGTGACAIPQGLATFALCDLFGSFFDPQAVGENNPMRIQTFFKQNWFTDFHQSYAGDVSQLLDFIRDAIRSKKSHRFFMPKVSISKDNGLPNQLLIGYNNTLILNVDYFTKRVIEVVRQIKDLIEKETMSLNDEKDNTKIVIRMAERIDQLKASSSKYDQLIQDLIKQNEFSSSLQIPFQTTSSLG